MEGENMKKQIITLCALSLLVSNAAVAATISKDLKGFNFNITTPANNSNSASSVKSTLSKAAMKAQIDSINSKVNNLSSTYQSSVNSLANNLLPSEQLKSLNEQKQKLQNSSKTANEISVEISNATVSALNKHLKSSASLQTFANLTTAQKTAVKKDLANLKNTSSSLTQITAQSKILVSQIKADPSSALELKSDLSGLVKTQVSVAKQVKSITKLTENLTTSASKAGISLE